MTKDRSNNFLLLVGSTLLLMMIVNIIGQIKDSYLDFSSKGERYTYCDHLRHLIYDHDMIFNLDECVDNPKTKLQIKLNNISNKLP